MGLLHRIFPLVADASMILFASSCCSLLNVSSCSTYKVTPLMLTVCHEDLLRDIVGCGPRWDSTVSKSFKGEDVGTSYLEHRSKGAGGEVGDRHEPLHPSPWARTLE